MLLMGMGKLTRDEVLARYYLWPLFERPNKKTARRRSLCSLTEPERIRLRRSIDSNAKPCDRDTDGDQQAL
jgi:hypothetical protein